MRRFRPLLFAFALLGADLPASDAAPDGGGADHAPRRDEALAYFENLPASNPYREVLLRYQNLPKKERDALSAWCSGGGEEEAPPPPLTPEQNALAKELSAALVAAGSRPATSRTDWPVLEDPDDPANPAAILSPGIGTVRALAKIASEDAGARPPGEALPIYAAVAQLGRQQRTGPTLIEQLVGVAVEGIAQSEVAKRLDEFSADELLHLSSLWDQLKAPPANAEALSGEREIFFQPLVENILVPGLRALLEDPDAGLESDSPAPDAGFTKDLRLAGLMDLGGGQHRIILEDTRSGESFSLDLGSATERIQLVSLDYEKRLAVIRSGKQEAVINLESKRIAPRKNPAVAFRRMFKGYDLLGMSEEGKTTYEKLLELARKHPGGADGYGKDLLAGYKAGIERRLELAESANAPEPDDESGTLDDPFLAMTIPTIGKLARTFNSSATQSVMLQAAIQHRLGQLNQSVGHSSFHDPWSDDKDRFELKPAPDGAGFVMTSRYEVNPGQPVTYKFAAPDAGFIRVTKP